MYYVNQTPAGGAGSLPCTPCSNASSPVDGEFFCQWNTTSGNSVLMSPLQATCGYQNALCVNCPNNANNTCQPICGLTHYSDNLNTPYYYSLNGVNHFQHGQCFQYKSLSQMNVNSNYGHCWNPQQQKQCNVLPYQPNRFNSCNEDLDDHNVPTELVIQNFDERFNKKKPKQVKVSKSYADSNEFKSLVISLLKKVSGHALPLFEFIEILKRDSPIYDTLFDLYKMNDICVISNGLTGPIISLTSENKQIELPYCVIHITTQWIYEELLPLPNVTMSLIRLRTRIHELLKTHNGMIPLASLITCYEAQFQQPINDDENGVPLEHLISCLSSVELCERANNVKVIVWANNNSIIKTKLNEVLTFLCREFVIILKKAPRCQLLFHQLIPAYHKHFGRQFKTADYGFTKLIDLLDVFKKTIQVIGTGNRKIVTLTHHEQAKRFTSHLKRVLLSQPNNEVTISEFPNAYERKFGKPLNITDYGVCQMYDILTKVPQKSVVVIDINDNDKLLAIPLKQ